MKRLFKFIHIAGWLSVFSVLTIVVLILAAITSQKKISFAGEPLINHYRNEAREKLITQTFIIKSKDGFGSGFRPQNSNAFITNHHVVDGLCVQGSCPSVALQYADWSDFQSMPLQVNFCSAWMDICVLVPQGEILDLPQLPDIDLSSLSQVAMVAHEGLKFSSNLSILTGKIVQRPAGLAILQLNIRHGYSGSPVFNPEGNVIGIVSRFEPNSLIQFISHLIHYGFYKYSAATEAVAIDIYPFIDLLHSKDQFQQEVKLFVDYERHNTLKWNYLQYLERVYRADVYLEGKQELCLKNPGLTEFEKNFQRYCKSSMNLVSLHELESEKIKLNEQIRFFIEKDQEIKEIIF